MDYLLDRSVTCITVLDISAAALARTQQRLGPRQEQVRWIEADVTGEWNVPRVDIWHDRAVFHFLIDAEDRARYRERVLQSLRPGGSAVIATFGPHGPLACSGLPTARYSPKQLAAELGGAFRLRETVREVHPTPTGTTQEFWYCRFTLEW